jgi:hypothetical protein
MTLNLEEAKSWSDEQLVHECEERIALLHQLGGWLYTGIVGNELSALEQLGMERHRVHPNAWREQGIIPTTWTDLFYVVHEWGGPCFKSVKPRPRPDYPMKSVTCLLCITT